MNSANSLQNKPSLHGIMIPGRRGRLFSTLYAAGGSGPHPTVLLLHGIPGNERNEDIAKELRRNGFHVLTFHYSGCFGSDGEYSLSNDLEDANTVLNYILSDEKQGFDKERIYAVGHSMGGFVCANIAAARDEIRGAVLITPCDIGRFFEIERENPREAERLEALLNESAGWLQGASVEGFLTELRESGGNYRLETAAASLVKKPVLCIEASLDEHTPPKYHCAPFVNALRALGGNIGTMSLETDHYASDCRSELTAGIVTFLSELTGGSFAR